MKEERNYTVYLHISPSNKYYVGITRMNPIRRWNNGYGYKSQVFYRAIQKYGWDNIDHEIIASNLTKEEAENFEVVLIKELHSNNPTYGYNIDNGGNTIGKISEETRIKMSEAKKGKRLSEEHKSKVAEAIRGRVHTEETREKISESMKGEKHPMYGKTQTEDFKNKISEAMKGGKNPRAKKVACEDREFDCVKDCAEFYKVNYYSMRYWLEGTRKMPQIFIERKLSYI